MNTSEAGPTPVAMTIAGSDNSAGAGAQADLKTFGAFGVYGLTSITCVVAEVPGLVSAIQPVETHVVLEQIKLGFDAFPVGAVKTGMLFSTGIIEVVARSLANRGVPIVVDPVMVASSGDPLLKPEAVAAYRELLFPLAALITPNADELAVLSGSPITGLAQMRDEAARLAATWNVPILAKGGHLMGPKAVDWLVFPDGRASEFSKAYIQGVRPHGTGCTYSSAIAACLALGDHLPTAVARAKEFITRAIASHMRWGATICLNHYATS